MKLQNDSVCFMNSTVVVNDSVIRSIVQNVTEHMQEDEKDSFFLAYAPHCRHLVSYPFVDANIWILIS